MRGIDGQRKWIFWCILLNCCQKIYTISAVNEMISFEFLALCYELRCSYIQIKLILFSHFETSHKWMGYAMFQSFSHNGINCIPAITWDNKTDLFIIFTFFLIHQSFYICVPTNCNLEYVIDLKKNF